jgi:hypothetical protein
LDQSLARVHCTGQGSGGEHHRIHNGHLGKALLQQVSDRLLPAIGADHDIGLRVQDSDQQGRFQIDLTVSAEQQDSPAVPDARLLQNPALAHVALHHLCDALGHRFPSPLRRLQVNGRQGNLEGQQPLDAGLPQRYKATDQDRPIFKPHGWLNPMLTP